MWVDEFVCPLRSPPPLPPPTSTHDQARGEGEKYARTRLTLDTNMSDVVDVLLAHVSPRV